MKENICGTRNLLRNIFAGLSVTFWMWLRPPILQKQDIQIINLFNLFFFAKKGNYCHPV